MNDGRVWTRPTLRKWVLVYLLGCRVISLKEMPEFSYYGPVRYRVWWQLRRKPGQAANTEKPAAWDAGNGRNRPERSAGEASGKPSR